MRVIAEEIAVYHDERGEVFEPLNFEALAS
jgi:hypothetical protein